MGLKPSISFIIIYHDLKVVAMKNSKITGFSPNYFDKNK